MRFLRPTLRIRMALLYGGLVLLVGVSLLFTCVILIDRAISQLPLYDTKGRVTIVDATGHKEVVDVGKATSTGQHRAVQYLIQTGLVYFGIIVVIGTAGGYLLAKQALRRTRRCRGPRRSSLPPPTARSQSTT